jgi:uncharacterized protein YbjT (DUF2867 family)
VQTPIDLGDIAAVASVVLREESYTGQRLLMSGPEQLTQPEEVALIGEAIGRELRFEELTHEQAVAAWAPSMGIESAEWLVDGFRMMAEYAAEPSPVVREVTGRPAKTYREWAFENAAVFRG